MQEVVQSVSNKEEIPIEQKNDGLFDEIGSSLRRSLRRIGIGALAATMGIGAVGCTPQAKSYLTGAYTKLPDPPPAARMQLGTSTEEDGKVFINYVVWDAGSKEFIRKDIHYATGVLSPGTFYECGGYTQEIRDGEVLYGGAIVDQTNSVIILGNGNTIDGPSGNVLNAQGQVMKVLGGEVSF